MADWWYNERRHKRQPAISPLKLLGVGVVGTAGAIAGYRHPAFRKYVQDHAEDILGFLERTTARFREEHTVESAALAGWHVGSKKSFMQEIDTEMRWRVFASRLEEKLPSQSEDVSNEVLSVVGRIENRTARDAIAISDRDRILYQLREDRTEALQKEIETIFPGLKKDSLDTIISAASEVREIKSEAYARFKSEIAERFARVTRSSINQSRARTGWFHDLFGTQRLELRGEGTPIEDLENLFSLITRYDKGSTNPKVLKEFLTDMSRQGGLRDFTVDNFLVSLTKEGQERIYDLTGVRALFNRAKKTFTREFKIPIIPDVPGVFSGISIRATKLFPFLRRGESRNLHILRFGERHVIPGGMEGLDRNLYLLDGTLYDINTRLVSQQHDVSGAQEIVHEMEYLFSEYGPTRGKKFDTVPSVSGYYSSLLADIAGFSMHRASDNRPKGILSIFDIGNQEEPSFLRRIVSVFTKYRDPKFIRNRWEAIKGLENTDAISEETRYGARSIIGALGKDSNLSNAEMGELYARFFGESRAQTITNIMSDIANEIGSNLDDEGRSLQAFTHDRLRRTYYRLLDPTDSLSRHDIVATPRSQIIGEEMWTLSNTRTVEQQLIQDQLESRFVNMLDSVLSLESSVGDERASILQLFISMKNKTATKPMTIDFLRSLSWYVGSVVDDPIVAQKFLGGVIKSISKYIPEDAFIEAASRRGINTLSDQTRVGQSILENAVERAVQASSRPWTSGPAEFIGNAFGTQRGTIIQRTGFIERLKAIGETEGADVWSEIKQVGKDLLSQIIAGRGIPENITGVTLAPYFFGHRINKMLGGVGLALSDRSMGSTFDIYQNMFMKRILPFLGMYHGYNYLNYEINSLTGGYTGLSDIVANVQGSLAVDVAAVSNMIPFRYIPFFGSSAKRYMFENFPGTERMFDEPKTGEEMERWLHSGHTEVRRNFAWLLSKGPYWGTSPARFEPSWYAQAKSHYLDETAIGGHAAYSHAWFPTPRYPLAPLNKIVDPYWWEREYSDERPYMSSDSIDPNSLFGGMFNAALESTPIFPGYSKRIDELAAGYAHASLKDLIIAPEVGKDIRIPIRPRSISIGRGSELVPQSPGGLVNAPSDYAVLNFVNSMGLQDIPEARAAARNIKNRTLFSGYGRMGEEGVAQEVGSEVAYDSIRKYLTSDRNLSHNLSNQFYTATEWAGLYGFMAQSLNNAIGGPLSGPRIVPESSSYTRSIGRRYWEQGWGGVGDIVVGNYDLPGAELLRRFLPSRRTDVLYYNPLPNDMPEWIPHSEFYPWRTGDPFSKVWYGEGESRLPGTGYEALYNVLRTPSGEYSLLQRFIILADVGYGSDEYFMAKEALLAMWDRLPIEAQAKIIEIEEQTEKRMDKTIITPYQHTGLLGDAWQTIAHANIPMLRKFVTASSVSEAYERNILWGKGTKGSWLHPFRDYIQPSFEYYSRAAGPIGAGLAGAFLGQAFVTTPKYKLIASAIGAGLGIASWGIVNIGSMGSSGQPLPGRVQRRFELEEYFDILRYMKYKGLATEAEAQGDIESFKQYKKMYEGTIYGAAEWVTNHRGDRDYLYWKVRRGVPRDQRDLMDELIEAPYEERLRVFHNLPEYQKKAFAKLIVPDIDYDTAPRSLQQYFLTHDLPSPDWPGWSAATDIETAFTSTVLAKTKDDPLEYEVYPQQQLEQAFNPLALGPLNFRKGILPVPSLNRNGDIQTILSGKNFETTNAIVMDRIQYNEADVDLSIQLDMNMHLHEAMGRQAYREGYY